MDYQDFISRNLSWIIDNLKNNNNYYDSNFRWILMQCRYIILGLGILLMIVAASGCVASNTNINMNNTTYSGDGINFNIPENWSVSRTDAPGGNININIDKTNPNDNRQTNIGDYIFNKGSSTQITVAVSPNPKNMSDQSIIDMIQNPNNQGGNYQRISNSTVTVDGNTAYENIYIVNDTSRFTGLTKEKEINFIKNGNTYGLIFDAPVQTFDQEETNFNITLNSIKLI